MKRIGVLRRSMFGGDAPKTPPVPDGHASWAAYRAAQKIGKTVPAPSPAPPDTPAVTSVVTMPQAHNLIAPNYRLPTLRDVHGKQMDKLAAKTEKRGLRLNDYKDNRYPRGYDAAIGHHWEAYPLASHIAQNIDSSRGGAAAWYAAPDGTLHPSVTNYLDTPMSKMPWASGREHFHNQLYLGLTDDDIDHTGMVGARKGSMGENTFANDPDKRQPMRDYLNEHGEGINPHFAHSEGFQTAQVNRTIPHDRLIFGHHIIRELPDDFTPRQYYEKLDQHLRDKFGYRDFPLEDIAGVASAPTDDMLQWDNVYRNRAEPGYKDDQGVWHPGNIFDHFRRGGRERFGKSRRAGIRH